MLVVVWLSLHRWDLLGPIRYVGLDNWRSVLTDASFGNSLLVTLAFIAIVVPVLAWCALHAFASKLGAAVLLGGGALAVLGFVDDFVELSARSRLPVQVVAVVAVVVLVPIPAFELPPLRVRRGDVTLLAHHFWKQLGGADGALPFELVRQYEQYPWPGNVRELRNIVERLLLLAASGDVGLATVRLALPKSPTAKRSSGHHGTLSQQVSDCERAAILSELRRQDHHITNTAKALGLERSHLYKKCQQLGIDLRREREGSTEAES